MLEDTPSSPYFNEVLPGGSPPAAARLYRVAFSFKSTFFQNVLFFIFIKTYNDE
jgi:hypothetical protein